MHPHGQQRAAGGAEVLVIELEEDNAGGLRQQRNLRVKVLEVVPGGHTRGQGAGKKPVLALPYK